MGKATPEIIRQHLLNGAKKVFESSKNNLKQVVYDTPESPNYSRSYHLWNSGRIQQMNKFAVKLSYGGPGTHVNYAQYVELGSSRMPPRPYLRPAIMQNIDFIKSLVKVGDSIEKIARITIRRVPI